MPIDRSPLLKSEDPAPMNSFQVEPSKSSDRVVSPETQNQFDVQSIKLPLEGFHSGERALQGGNSDASALRAVAELVTANQLIQDLPSDQKKLWREYQISIAEHKDNPDDYAMLLARRNANFLEISNHLREAEQSLGAETASKVLPQLELVNSKPTMGLLSRGGSDSGKSSMENMLSAVSKHERAPHHKGDSFARSEASEALRKINKPGYAETASLRAEHYSELLQPLVPTRITRADAEAVMRNPLATPESKDRFFQQIERLISGEPNATIDFKERVLVSLQLLHQAGDVESIDQGEFKTCGLSTLEKRLLMRDPGLVARMVSDVALTGSTKTETQRSVSLEKDWLRPQAPESVSYPPQENTRSLASQYVALILGNVKFQINNEQKGTNYRFGHVNGNDVVLDYAAKPPSPVYRNSITGKVDTDPVHRFDDGKIMVGPNLRPWRKPLENSPHINEKDIIDTYSAVTGESGENMVMLHYSQARGPVEKSLAGIVDWATLNVKPRDSRVSVYRTEGEMQAQIQRAKDSNNLPLIFLSPNHAATINGFNTETNRVSYDNQWGKAMDFSGAKSLDTRALFTLGARIMPQTFEPGKTVVTSEQAMEVVKSARRQYERWCTTNGVQPDSRYPTRDEFVKWYDEMNKLNQSK